MRAYVFTDEALASQAGRFVWLALDVEKAENAKVKAKLPIEALPTYFVLDPKDEKVVMRWVGGFTVAQAGGFLDEASAAASGKKKGKDIDRELAEADRLYGEGKLEEAAAKYGKVVAAAPPGFGSYGRAVDALIYALQSTEKPERAAKVAGEALPRVAGTVHEASVAASGLACALELEATHAERKELVSRFEAATRQALEDETIVMAADDRSGIYGILLDARKDAKDEVGARKVAADWVAFLEKAAEAATTADARAVFDPHRLSAYIELGQAEKAIPMLEASERDLPDDYNPPARLAITYKELKKYPEALAASDRALAKVYGPRKIRVYIVRSEIHQGAGDGAAALRTMEEALAYAKKLPEGQRSERMVESLQGKVDALKEPAKKP